MAKHKKPVTRKKKESSKRSAWEKRIQLYETAFAVHVGKGLANRYLIAPINSAASAGDLKLRGKKK